jgi:hypothetical protein
MTRKKIILPFLAAIIALSANAQTDSTKTFILSGSVDAYSRLDFNNVTLTNPTTGVPVNAKTSFTQTNNSFELGMATLRGDGQILSGKVFGTADLGFGPRASSFNAANGSADPTLLAVKQLYLGFYTGKGAKGVKFTIGKWATHIGYELVDAYANRNYSMDYMFTTGPFSHTGIKAEYTKGTWGFMLGVANPTNIVTIPDATVYGSATKHLLAQVSDGSKNGKYKVYLNYEGSLGMGQSGSGSLKSQNQIDLVATALLSSKFNIGLNLTDKINSYNSVTGGTTPKSDAWGGAALYLNWDPTALFGLTLRSEYFIDGESEPGGTTPTALIYGTRNILDETLSANFRVGPLTIIPELRYESADTKYGDIYVKGKDATGTGSDFSGILAAVYKF